MTKAVPPPKKDQPELVPLPNEAGILEALGWISIIGGVIALLIGAMEKMPLAYMAAGSGITMGAIMLGLSKGLGLLTRIANLLARMLHKPEPEKPAQVSPHKPAPTKKELYRL